MVGGQFALPAESHGCALSYPFGHARVMDERVLAELDRGPWAAFAAAEGIDVRVVVLPPGVMGACARVDGRVRVGISRELGRVERRATAAHELEHVLRGGGCETEGMPPGWWAVWARDELAVDHAVSRELVPAVELDGWLALQLGMDEGVAPLQVADEWEVPVTLARLALEDAVVRARLREEAAAAGPVGCVTFEDLPAEYRQILDVLQADGRRVEGVVLHFGVPERAA